MVSGLRRGKTTQEAARLADLVGFEEGWSVAEVGAGTGEFAESLSVLAGPSGRVFVTEFDEGKLEKLKEKFTRKHLANVQVLKAGETSGYLPMGQLDLIAMRKVYHHFTKPKAMNESFYKSLKPGGWLAVVDFAPKWFLRFTTPKGIPKNRGGHGIPKNILIEEIKAARFNFVQDIDNWLPGQLYCLLFRKPVILAD